MGGWRADHATRPHRSLATLGMTGVAVLAVQDDEPVYLPSSRHPYILTSLHPQNAYPRVRKNDSGFSNVTCKLKPNSIYKNSHRRLMGRAEADPLKFGPHEHTIYVRDFGQLRFTRKLFRWLSRILPRGVRQILQEIENQAVRLPVVDQGYDLAVVRFVDPGDASARKETARQAAENAHDRLLDPVGLREV